MMQPEIAKWATRFFMTPAYNVAMLNLQAGMVRHPVKYSGEIARVMMMRAATSVIFGIKGYAAMNFYRFIRRELDERKRPFERV